MGLTKDISCKVGTNLSEKMSQISLYLQSGFYILAGLNHFRNERFYLKMMPDYLPLHMQLVFWSGVFEVVLGVGLLFSASQSYAAWGIILLLIAVLPANIFMITSGRFIKIPQWFLYARIPLQVLLLWWAYSFT
jgi:uncharacterized membrane protein